VQEGTAQENTYEDKQTNRVLEKQNIESHIFHLPIDCKIDAILGHGAHGVVAAATIASADKRIAIKQIKLNLEPRNDEENLYQWKSVCRELSLLRRLSKNGGHPNVIMLQDVVFVSTSNQHEIMFLINLMKTSLDTLMKSGSLTSEEKQRYIYQILCGLHYLHANSISE
jgi:serine/threonine protein kinase